jgi:hypothetical protein
MSPLAVAMVWFGYPAGKGTLFLRFTTWIVVDTIALYLLAKGKGKTTVFFK